MREPLVLCYHAVSPHWDVGLSVDPDQLGLQVRMLLRMGYTPARFSDALLRPEHEKCFVVTFDDAFRSVLRHAAPVLGALGVPATLFVPTGWVGGEHPRALWDDMGQWRRPGRDEELELMDWGEVRELAALGWEIGAHTESHPHLTATDDATLRWELEGSKARLEAELNRPCTSIAYPYGDVDVRVAEAARAAGFAAGAGLHDMSAFLRDRAADPLRWRRLGVYRADTPARFAVKLALSTQSTARATTIPAAIPPGRAGAEVVQPGSEAARRARVAVLIPCYNDGELAREAVASIVEDEPVEVVVVDDGSPDPATVAALDELRARGVTVLRHEDNQGLSAARRTALAATQAPFVFPLDADDLAFPGALGRLADRLEGDPRLAVTWGDTQDFGSRERRHAKPLALEPYRVAFRNEYPVCSLFRRDALAAVGAWQDVGGMSGYEDWSLWMTLAERGYAGRHAGPGTVTLRYRLHGPRMMADAAKRHRLLYEALKREHPALFDGLPTSRRTSALGRVARLAYPVAFGARPPLGLRTRCRVLARRVRHLAPGAD